MVVSQDTTVENITDTAHHGDDEYDEELDEKSTDFIDETFDTNFSPDGYTNGLVFKV